MQYSYTAIKNNGETVTGTLEADTEERAEDYLWKSDLTIVKLQKKRDSISMSKIMPSFFGVKRDDIINFSADLATLLGSGIGILPALVMLYERTTRTGMKNLIRELLVAVETGSSFSEACAQHPNVFSPFYIRLTKVGEEIGNLELMLRQITIQMRKEAAIVSKVRSAIAYPAFVLAVAIVAVIVMITFVLPAMSGLFDELGGELPMVTRIMMGTAMFLRNSMVYIVIAVAVIGLGSWLYFRTPGGKRTWGIITWKVPLIKDVSIKSSMSRMARNLSILLTGGVPLTESLELVINTTDNVPFKEALTKVHSDVHSGQLMSRAMMNYSLFPPLLTQVVGVGEQTGRMETNLETVADFYETETDKAVSRATGMLGPILVVMVGLIVAFIAMSMLSPIYSLAGQIG